MSADPIVFSQMVSACNECLDIIGSNNRSNPFLNLVVCNSRLTYMLQKYFLFSSGLKGLLVLQKLVNSKYIPFLVYIEKDHNLENDSSSEIFSLCKENNITCYFYSRFVFSISRESFVAIAIGWRKLISNLDCPLIVMHDSLLPKYRGYSPTVSQPINGERVSE